MKERFRKCKLCGKQIKVKAERIGVNRKNNKTHLGLFMMTSNEGVTFETGKTFVWFCNECWYKLRK